MRTVTAEADRSAVFSMPVQGTDEATLILQWLDGMYRARLLRGFGHRLQAGEHGTVLTILVERPALAARVLLDVAYSGGARPLLLARLWALPGCVAGLAQDLDRPVDEVRSQLEALGAAGLAYEHRGIWRARALSRGGEA